MKVLLVGGGAREHAIAVALKKDPELELYTVMNNRNPGIKRLSEDCSNHIETDVKRTVEFGARKKVDFAFIGPEAPLEVGLADSLEKSHIPCVGPKKTLARIESDKEFMRGLMEKYKVPCSLGYRAFSDFKEASSYLDEIGEEVAVKPVGLTGGKGVKVIGEQLKNSAEARVYIKKVIEKGVGGGRVVLEEKAFGEEFTLQAFVDGKRISPMPAVQDHKRAYEGDTGHNTGGMGSYSGPDLLVPFLKRSVYEKAENVMKKTVGALRDETGEDYKGVLYGQFMLGKELKLIEFNCRFGDPEAMNALSIMKPPLTDVSESILNGSLGNVSFQKKATVCKYVVPEGYGVKSISGEKLTVDEAAIRNLGALIYYAAVDERNGGIYTTSSRSVGLVGIGDSIKEAEQICEKAVGNVKGKHIYHRSDIGTGALIQRKLEKMKALK